MASTPNTYFAAVYPLLQMAAGGLLKTDAAYLGAKSQASSLSYQASMADINSQIGEMGAETALLHGQQQAGALGLRMGQVEGAQRADLAANGVDLGVGSAAEVQAGTKMMTNEDLATIHANAVQDAWGYRMSALNQNNTALMDRATASGINPGLSAGTTLLTSGMQTASMWYRLRHAQVGPAMPVAGPSASLPF